MMRHFSQISILLPFVKKRKKKKSKTKTKKERKRKSRKRLFESGHRGASVVDLRVSLSEAREDKNFEERDPQTFRLLIIRYYHREMSSINTIRSAFQSPRSLIFTVRVQRIEKIFSSLRRWFYNVYVSKVVSFTMSISINVAFNQDKHSSATCVKQRQTFALQNTSSSSTQIQFLLLLDCVT